MILSKLIKNRKRITHLLLFRQSNHNRYIVTTTMKYTVLIAMSIIHLSILLVAVVVIHISYVGEPTFIVVLGWWEFRDVNFVCGGGILMDTILLMWNNKEWDDKTLSANMTYVGEPTFFVVRGRRLYHDDVLGLCERILVDRIGLGWDN